MSVFDPLGSTADIFANNDDNLTAAAPWPTTPHPPGSPIPNLRRASTPIAQAADKGPAQGIYGKEPRIYGAPEPGLISPRETVGPNVNGAKYEKAEPYLRIRVTGLDRNRRDVLVKLDAQTNLSNFTGNTYRNVSRSYVEFQQLHEALCVSNPQTIIPALPLAQTSAPSDEEDDRLVRIMLQRWLSRICDDPIVLHDEELRSFVESDFGYQPTPRPKKKAGSGFSLIRRTVPDEDEHLQRARFELTKVETQFFDAAKAIDKLALARKTLASAQVDMGNTLINVATVEVHPPLGNAFRKIGRTWHSLADLGQAQAVSECVILADTLGYEGLNSRSAKETLQQRTGVLEEYQAAVKSTISKRRNIERMKASSNIRPEKVDEALEEIEEANKYEQILARRAEGISQNLHRALDRHNRLVHEDITAALIEHVRSSIMYERQHLRELEALKPDVNGAAEKHIPKPITVHQQPYIPPLAKPPVSANEHVRSPAFNASAGPSTSRSAAFGPPTTAASAIASSSKFDPLGGSGPTTPVSATSSTRPSISTGRDFYGPQPSSSSIAGPSTPSSSRATPDLQAPPLQRSQPQAQPANQPPLGGRFADGTRSMFITPTAHDTTSPLHSPLHSSAAPQARPFTPQSSTLSRPAASPLGQYEAAADPLSATLPTPASASSANGRQAALGNDLDPLGMIKASHMSQSMRIQPTRPRLDPREAASKLANMF